MSYRLYFVAIEDVVRLINSLWVALYHISGFRAEFILEYSIRFCLFCSFRGNHSTNEVLVSVSY